CARLTDSGFDYW
nr:immunoglobulin heavy chain junction region [Macaca mulatta]MOY26524.1 immunoglobulin heavy chain junction region [Macaca mulatta]